MTREDCRKIIGSLLTPKRLHHSECVADAAVALAAQYGANEQQAMLAGMLHDCMKRAPGQEREEPTRHAFAGAEYLEQECGVADEAVLNAVRWHTTGHAGMTLLEEVVFVADLISADRDYPDVETVRELSGQDLHAASKYILEFIFAKLERESRRRPHPDSIAWYSELEGGIKCNPMS